ncbi:MAG TPA: tRNA pseudouridine(55) synthase TruB [Burkholderiales bacterium]|nr:tRNA pseudouridine(55) synthase TruB [Burkholderiales bacterium]
MDAALLLDKPVGLTSNAALQRAKRLLGGRKAGHAGTLDPLASGLLVVLFGEATKFAGPLLEDDKEYRATVRLGERTATGDAEGPVLERRAVTVGQAEVLAVLPRFRGAIDQVPPMYSALKSEGRPLYELARKGLTVERRARRVEIARLELLRFEAPDIDLDIRCSKGTYVRALAEDLGAALGTGAHLAALRRTGSGVFRVENARTLDALEALSGPGRAETLIPLAQLLSGLPRADLDQEKEVRFRNGQSLPFEGASGLCGVFGAAGNVVGLGRADAHGLHPVRLTATQAAE